MPRQLVQIVSADTSEQITVRDARGTTFAIHRDLLDGGFQLLLASGEWVHETDPEVYSELARIKREGLFNPTQEQLIDLILERNRQIFSLRAEG